MKTILPLWIIFILWTVGAAAHHLLITLINIPLVQDTLNDTGNRLQRLLQVTMITGTLNLVLALLLATVIILAAYGGDTARRSVRIVIAAVLLIFGVMAAIDIPLALLHGTGLNGALAAAFLGGRALIALLATVAGIGIFFWPTVALVFAALLPFVHIMTAIGYQIALYQAVNGMSPGSLLAGFIGSGVVFLLLSTLPFALRKVAVLSGPNSI